MHPPSRSLARRLGGALSLLCLAVSLGCEVSDLGSPCNHGPNEPQEDLTVTFPALSCNALLCVYADRQDPPGTSCQSHAECNDGDASSGAFVCVDGECTVSGTHVLSRSMCSQFCSADSDCSDAAPDTHCKTGFACVPPQDLGRYCCQSMCVCRDDLDLPGALERAALCKSGTHPGCCVGPDRPETCGPAD